MHDGRLLLAVALRHHRVEGVRDLDLGSEALGDLLMALDRPAEALRAYQASDVIWPGRFNTLLGGTHAALAADILDNIDGLVVTVPEQQA